MTSLNECTFPFFINALRSVSAELVIFFVTAAIGLAFRYLNKFTTQYPTVESKSKGASAPRYADAQDRRLKPRRASEGRERGCAQDPGEVVNEIVEVMRSKPGKHIALHAQSLYNELNQVASKHRGCSIQQAAQRSRYDVLDLYGAALQAAVRAGQAQLVHNIIDDMVAKGIPRSLDFYECAMKLLAGQRMYHLALHLYDRLVADGFEPSAVTCSCMINFAAEIGKLDRAVVFFKKLATKTTPSIRAYMATLRVFSKKGDWAASLELLHGMQARGVRLDSLALNVVLATGVAADKVPAVAQFLTEIETNHPNIPDVVSYNTMLKGHAQRNDAESGLATITRMRKKNLNPNSITFNTAMDAAVRSLNTPMALDILRQMRAAGLKPDKYTCSIFVKHLAKNPDKDDVISVLDLLRTDGCGCEISLQVALYHSVLAAAGKTGDSATVIKVYMNMTQSRIVPIAPAKAKLRELIVAHSLHIDDAIFDGHDLSSLVPERRRTLHGHTSTYRSPHIV